MALPPKLETYLASLDRALTPIAVSDRADIVTEIKSHVLDAMERQGEAELPKILAALGEPEAVANRYLLERGLKPGPPARRPMMQWLTIGFLGTFGLVLLFTGFIVWRFSPVVAIDGEEERISILGGFVDIDGKAGRVNIGGVSMGGGEERKVSGERPVDPGKVEELEVPFRNGKVEMESSTDGKLHWSCRLRGSGGGGGEVREEGKRWTLDLSDAAGVSCELQVPAGLRTALRGNNGKIRVKKPGGELVVKLDNGDVRLEPDPNRRYRYDIKVANGSRGSFESSTAADALRVSLSVGNGRIARD